jgi:hypothetical protein
MPVAPMTATVRRVGLWLAAGVLAVYASTAGGSLTSIDAVMTYEVTKSLVSHGSTAFDRPGINNHPGVDGRFYSPFGIGQSLFNVPFYLAARAAERHLGVRVGRSDTLEKAGVAMGSTVAATGAVWVVFLFAWRLAGRLDAAVATALTCAFGTLLWPYSKFGFNQALTAWCLTAGIYAAWLGVRASRRGVLFWSGVWLACAFLTRHEMALAAAVVAVWVAAESRADRREGAARLACVATPLLCAVVFWLWYNAVRFGHPLDTGNLGPAEAVDDQHFSFSGATLAGVAGLLFSPGRALFLYAPVAAACLASIPSLARRDRSLAWLIVGAFTSLLVLYGSLRYWDGLRGYGPRYLVPLLPLLTVPLALWVRRGRTRLKCLIVASVLVQLPGILVDFSKVSVEHARTVENYTRDAKIYSLRESALVLNAEASVTAVPDNVGYLLRRERPAAVSEPADEGDGGFAQRFAFSLDFWWLYLYYLGVLSASTATCLGLVPLAAGLTLLWLARRASLKAPTG